MLFHYAPAPDFSALRSELDVAARELSGGDELCVLYAERAVELEGLAALVEALGTPSFARLAARHFTAGTAGEAECARTRADEWSRAGHGPALEAAVRSDDRAHPDSLVNQLSRHIGRLRLPVGIRVVDELASKAAIGDGVILVRAGVALGAGEAQRIALHELHGHMLPRLAARAQPLGLYRVGSAGSGADEEGRALLIEERAGLMQQSRRFELGLRHLAALAVRSGVEAFDVVRELHSFGCPLPEAVAIYTRVARGGGLCRELTYVPGWQRARDAFAEEPELERWLEHGRISIAAARRLRALGDAPIAGPFASE